MPIFEAVLILLLCATVLSVIARQTSIPYPTLLAVGGASLAFVPGAPRLDLPPELILALFVAPVLLDAAYDTSIRDLQENWRPVLSLVMVAVGLTTLFVALAIRQLMPDAPWAAAVALGALLAPPDAVAALAVLRHVNPPHRIRKVLEGESLLNDASALLIYKLAVAAVAVGEFSLPQAIPTFVFVAFGSLALGWALSWPTKHLIERLEDGPTSVIFQFVITFGVWILADRLGLSPVVAIVAFGLAASRSSQVMSARLRISTFAVWETVTFVLNVFAFMLVGLQLRPVLVSLGVRESLHLLSASLAILAVVVVVRLAWVMAYILLNRKKQLVSSGGQTSSRPPLSAKEGLVIGWSGMRGLVTLGAAAALPEGFPLRDFIQLTAFVVVLGTLVLQGLTLKPLVVFLNLPMDTRIENEIDLARAAALNAALAELEEDQTSAARHLMTEYREALVKTRQEGSDAFDTAAATLRQRVVPVSRTAIEKLRIDGVIGDDAYRVVEEELDWLELSSKSVRSE